VFGPIADLSTEGKGLVENVASAVVPDGFAGVVAQLST